MNKENLWFIRERAEAFALLLLTKRDDVIVRAHSGTDMAIDFLVEVLKDGKSANRFFGVQMVAYMDLPDLERADDRVLSHFGKDPKEAMIPICVFVIGVRKPEGVFRWIVEPVLENGQALLRRDVEPNWRVLDEGGVNQIITQVIHWNDVLQNQLTARNAH